MIEEFIKWNEAHIIWWRKAINRFMLKEYGIELEFLPKIDGEKK